MNLTPFACDASARRVHVILDPEFGPQALDLPFGEPAWIVASPVNEPVVRHLWQERPAASHLHGMTLFQSHGDVEQSLLEVLDTVDLHHGGHPARLLYSQLEVTGCLPSPGIVQALAGLGFRVTDIGSTGFSAERSHV